MRGIIAGFGPLIRGLFIVTFVFTFVWLIQLNPSPTAPVQMEDSVAEEKGVPATATPHRGMSNFFSTERQGTRIEPASSSPIELPTVASSAEPSSSPENSRVSESTISTVTQQPEGVKESSTSTVGPMEPQVKIPVDTKSPLPSTEPSTQRPLPTENECSTIERCWSPRCYLPPISKGVNGQDGSNVTNTYYSDAIRPWYSALSVGSANSPTFGPQCASARQWGRKKEEESPISREGSLTHLNIYWGNGGTPEAVGKDLVCSSRNNFSETSDARGHRKTSSDEKALHRFAELTGRPFRRSSQRALGEWSLKANCRASPTIRSLSTRPPLLNRSMRGEFLDGAETGGRGPLYRLSNVCVRPTGGLLGYQPHVMKFTADDEVYPWEQNKDTWTAARRYIETIEEMPSPSTCFLDTKVIMVPLVPRSNNPGHVFQRMAAILDIRKRAWPEAGPENVTMMYVFTEGLTHRIPGDPHDLSDWSQLAFRHYTEIVAGSHFGVFAQDLDGAGVSEAARSLYGDLVGESRRALRAPVCFSEMVVYFTCTYAECEAARRGAAPRPIIPLFWQRSGALLEAFCDEVRRCGGLPARRPEPNRTHPTVLLSMRTRDRRWMLTPSIIGRLGAAVEAKGGRLIVHEMRESGTMELARLYSAADVLIGPYGAGLFYGIFMPSGAVGVEIGHTAKTTLGGSGINRHAASDYGGNYGAVNITHVAALFSYLQVARLDGSSDIGFEAIEFLLGRALCLLQNPPDGAARVCDFAQDDLHKRQVAHDEDANGQTLVEVVRMLQPELDARLWALVERPTLGASILRPVRGEALHRKMIRENPRVLIVTPCGITRAVEQEITFLQMISMHQVELYTWKPRKSDVNQTIAQCERRRRPLTVKPMQTCERLGSPPCHMFYLIISAPELTVELSDHLRSTYLRTGTFMFFQMPWVKNATTGGLAPASLSLLGQRATDSLHVKAEYEEGGLLYAEKVLMRQGL